MLPDLVQQQQILLIFQITRWTVCHCLKLSNRLGSFLTKIKPDLIFTHHSGDINIDHDLTQRAVMTATRALPKSKPMEVLACEVLSSTEFGPAN